MIEIKDPIDPNNVSKILALISDAIDVFDQQTAQVPYVPYPVEIYETLCAAFEIISEFNSLHSVREDDEPESQYNRFAIDELTDRLSDAISENVELSVQLRMHTNQKASDEFIASKLADIFNKGATE